MAKTLCAACGKEIGLIQQTQLADRSYICRDCAKKTIPFFRPLETTYSQYEAHQKQLEDGAKLYDAYFNKNKNVKTAVSKHVCYDPETALLCLTGMRGEFIVFGGTRYSNVFRIADLDVYDTITETVKGSDGKNVEKHYLHLTFRNVYGIYEFKIPAEMSSIKLATKIFNEALGGKGIVNSVKTSIQKTKDQINAAKNILGNVKEAMGNIQNGEVVDQAAVEGNAAQVAEEMNNMFYAGREALIEKVDAAIKKVLG